MRTRLDVAAPGTRPWWAAFWFLVVSATLVAEGAAAADTPSTGAMPKRHGPSASVAIGAGYSLAESETGGVSVLTMADIGWFATDRFAVLGGATLVSRFGEDDVHHTLLRLGVEYRLDPRHYLRLSAGGSLVIRERDESDAKDGFENIGVGEGAQLIAGIPAVMWCWGEVNFQVVAGGGLHHGDVEASYAAFLMTCLELALR